MSENKIKNLIISIGFVVLLTLALLVNILAKDKKISTSERRKLTQVPDVTVKKVLSGETMEDFEDYVVDQFVLRDFFRSIKSFCSTKILKQKDTNKLFEIDGSIYEMEYQLNRSNIEKNAEKINDVYEKYLNGMNVYYAIIPDKNYYLENDDHLKIDYAELKNIMMNALKNLKYIDIWDDLKLEDYYKTDAHWRQENLKNVVTEIQKNMKLEDTSSINYTQIDKGEFYGGYYGQLGMDLLPDNMYILTNETLEKCTTYNYETKQTRKVYEESKTTDKYDIYLQGATPLISIENPSADTEKELLLFRDSYASSLAPLLTENYSKITLIDIRYISVDLLKNYIEFNNQDVLFLYSTLLLNKLISVGI